MRIEYLVPNQVWVLLFGEQLIDLDGVRTWATKAQLLTDLRYKGLTVRRKSNKVVPLAS